MTGDELGRLIAEAIEYRLDRPFIEQGSPPHRTERGWVANLRIADGPDSYRENGLGIGDGHPDARIRAFVAAVGRYVRAHRRIPIHLGPYGPNLLDAPIGDDAFDRVLDDPRAHLILDRAQHDARLLATIDPERRGHIPVLSNPELEAALATDGAHAVYGDWLSQRGDPRGELIAVQLALGARPDDATLAQREAELLELYAYEWLGPLAWSHPGELTLGWRHGFIERMVFDRPTEEDFPPRISLLDAIRALVALPNLSCLRELELGGEDRWPGDDFWAVLAEVGLPASVRRLAITATHKFLRQPVSIVSTYPVLAQLDDLEIGFHQIDLGDALPLPDLRSLSLHRVSRTNLAALRASRFPRLERLYLRLSHRFEGDDMEPTLDDLAWLRDAGSLPALRRLGLGGTVTGPLVAALAGSPLIRQLEILDLSEAWASFELRQALEAVRPALAHLDLRPPTRHG